MCNSEVKTVYYKQSFPLLPWRLRAGAFLLHGFGFGLEIDFYFGAAFKKIFDIGS
jgi:hypothetical protein